MNRKTASLIFALFISACCVSGIAKADDPGLAVLEEKAMRKAVEHVAPCVVRIETVGGLEKVGNMLIGQGPTTGLIVSADGYIISSAFNFVQQPSSILVTLPDDTRAPAKVIAKDHSRMLVLLKVNTDSQLPTPEPVPAKEIRVGQWSIALGRTFASDLPNVSVGIVSALDRIFGRALQTDAKISPNNYGGPLIDLRGRVFGVLVPMSPQDSSELAGFEWYDGGIGFAVPLENILAQLPKLKEGKDLHRGLMGITMKPGDPYVQPAVIATARAKSPAREAGFLPGDEIVEVAGQKISSQMQLQLQMGRRYAGEKVELVALRDGTQVKHEITLTDQLPAYQDPFLGILPLRTSAEKPDGIKVRYVYPDSPAAMAKMEIGDVITKIGETETPVRAQAIAALNSFSPGDEVALTVKRGEKTLDLKLTAARMPTKIPGDLPPARAEEKEADNKAPADADAPELGRSEIKLPEFANNVCRIYVPESYRPGVAHGVLLWLHGSGGDDPDELIARWSGFCKTNELILVAPQATDVLKWSPTESEFVMKALETVAKRYTLDSARIVAHGYQAGGAMAYLLTFQNREVFTGVVPVDAPLPGTGKVADNEPGKRLAVLAWTSSKARFAARIENSIETLKAAEYPVTVKELSEEPRYLQPDELTMLVRWIDALDRF